MSVTLLEAAPYVAVFANFITTGLPLMLLYLVEHPAAVLLRAQVVLERRCKLHVVCGLQLMVAPANRALLKACEGP